LADAPIIGAAHLKNDRMADGVTGAQPPFFLFASGTFEPVTFQAEKPLRQIRHIRDSTSPLPSLQIDEVAEVTRNPSKAF
jgi:hypothetical protein